MCSLLIIKLGGSAISDKNVPKSVRFDVIRNVCNDIKRALEEDNYSFILIHGGGSFGHPLAKEYNLRSGLVHPKARIGFSKTLDAMRELSMIVSYELRNHGIPVFPIQPSAITIMKSGSILKMNIDVVKLALKKGFIPLLWGDVSLDPEKGCDIVSGDYIIEFLARELRPDKVIFGTDVEGIYRDPKDPTSLIPLIDERNLFDVRKFLKNTQKIDVTGGMIEKLNSIVRISKLGVLVQVISLLSSGNVYRAIKGEKIGTIVRI